MTRAVGTAEDPLRFHDGKPPLGLIAGPTASGKSGYAVALAQAVQASGRPAAIINADSAQMYADLCVLSARPAQNETGGVDHRLYGVWDGARAGSAVEWAQLAKTEIAAVHAAGGVPILVGGTGLYLRILLEGVAPIPAIADEVRDSVRAMPHSEARRALEREDADTARLLAPADRTRTQRALEVVRATGRSIGEWRTMKKGGIEQEVAIDARILLPPRDRLHQRANTRFQAMVRDGAIGEVEALLARNLEPSVPVMRAIGVPELSAYLRGAMTLAEATASGQTATRQYAKRQCTWFTRQSPREWRRLTEGF